jgi:dihydrofolate reductase
MNAIPKYVVSSTLRDEDLTWNNTTRIATSQLRALDENLLVMGSPTLVRTLLEEDLVDELRLIVMPVILGGGKTIFPDDGGLHTFQLVSSATSPNGVQVCVYRTALRP